MSQFSIHSVPVGNGTVALSPLPGRKGDYANDRDMILNWRPDLVISMTTDLEMLQEGAGGFSSDLRAEAISWAHLPVVDFGAPPPAIDVAWSEVSASAAQILSQRGRVLVHCRGGCGRSGMIILRLMVEHGEPTGEALKRLRAVRPCAVETEGQMEWASRPARTQ